MTLERLIALVLIGIVGYLFVQTYEPEIREMMGEAKEVRIDPLTQARTLAQRTQYDQAIKYYDMVLAESNADTQRLQDALIGKAEALERSRQLREAIVEYQKYLNLYPTNPEVKNIEARLERLRIETGQ